MPITAAKFSAEVAERLPEWGMNKKDVDLFLDVLVDEIAYQLKQPGNRNAIGVASVPIRGLGKVKLRKTPAKKARMGRNPATGEPVQIGAKPAGKRVSVTVQKAFKESVGA